MPVKESNAKPNSHELKPLNSILDPRNRAEAAKVTELRRTVSLDLKRCINKFAVKRSTSYDEFSEIWRDLKLDTLFYGLGQVNRTREVILIMVVTSVCISYILYKFSYFV